MRSESGQAFVVVAIVGLLVIGLAILFVASGGFDSIVSSLESAALRVEQEHTAQLREERLAEEARTRREQAKWDGQVMLEYAQSSALVSAMTIMMPYVAVTLGLIVGTVVFVWIVDGAPKRRPRPMVQAQFPGYASDREADRVLARFYPGGDGQRGVGDETSG